MSENEQKEVFRMGKNAGEDLVFSTLEYMGRTYFDIRIWTRVIPNVKTESIPTKKGIRVVMDDLAEFLKGVEKLNKEK